MTPGIECSPTWNEIARAAAFGCRLQFRPVLRHRQFVDRHHTRFVMHPHLETLRQQVFAALSGAPSRLFPAERWLRHRDNAFPALLPPPLVHRRNDRPRRRSSCDASLRSLQIDRHVDRHVDLTNPSLQESNVAMIKVSVLCANRNGATFDMDYYCNRHIMLVRQLLGDAVKGLEVDQGVDSKDIW